jgi:hypothetical protein
MRQVNGTRTIAIGERGGPPGSVHCVLNFDNGVLAIQRSGGTELRVNEVLVDASRRLEIGDIVRVGDPVAELRIVALED